MKNILVPVDFSDLSLEVINKAAEIAFAFKSKIWLIHIASLPPAFVGFDMVSPADQTYQDEDLQQQERELQLLEKHVQDKGLDARALLVKGLIVDSILEQAEKVESDLIVMGSHNHGFFYKTFLGSVSEGVMRKSKIPVLIVPEKE
ncbi:MAG: universal stress protein [Lentimicrobiaceae bacterium]|nr:universal stress protein [Lentimicrobiaceae bacterium]